MPLEVGRSASYDIVPIPDEPSGEFIEGQKAARDFPRSPIGLDDPSRSSSIASRNDPKRRHTFCSSRKTDHRADASVPRLALHWSCNSMNMTLETRSLESTTR
jgi:hypothetical protein